MSEQGSKGRKIDVRTLGVVACAIPTVYFGAMTVYALLNFPDFGSAPPQFFRYVFAPLLIVCGLVWSAVRLKPANALLIGINVSAVLAALFIHEALAQHRIIQQLVASADAVKDARSDAAGFLNSPPPGATIRQLNREIGAKTLGSSFLGGIPDREVLLCRRADGPVTYRSDRFGFNNPDEIHSQGGLDVALFGDSFTEGMCLEPGDDVGGQLRARGVRAASFGFRGNGPLIELAAMGRFGPATQPKLSVLMFYAGNDWENLEEEVKIPWLMEALDDEARFGSIAYDEERIAAASAIVEKLWVWQATGKATYKTRLLRNFLALTQTSVALGLHYPAASQPSSDFDAILRRMPSLAASWGGEVALVYIPRAERYRGALPHDFVFEASRRAVLDRAAAAGVPVIDLAETFSTADDPMSYYGPDGHFSEKGAAAVAALIAAHAGKVATGSATAMTLQ